MLILVGNVSTPPAKTPLVLVDTPVDVFLFLVRSPNSEKLPKDAIIKDDISEVAPGSHPPACIPLTELEQEALPVPLLDGSPKSTASPFDAIVTLLNSGTLIAEGPGANQEDPPVNIPRVGEAHPEFVYGFIVKSPKSIASPSVAIST